MGLDGKNEAIFRRFKMSFLWKWVKEKKVGQQGSNKKDTLSIISETSEIGAKKLVAKYFYSLANDKSRRIGLLSPVKIKHNPKFKTPHKEKKTIKIGRCNL